MVASELNRAPGGLDLLSLPRDYLAAAQDELLGQVFDPEMLFTCVRPHSVRLIIVLGFYS